MLKLVIVGVLVLSPMVGAASPSSTAPSTAAPAAPAAPLAPATIPVPEIAQRAEDVAKLLRDLDESRVPGPIVVTIEKRLPEIVERLAALSKKTTSQLDLAAGPAALDELTDQWRTSRALLMGYVETLAQRARSIEATLEHLTQLRDTWTRARADARASRAPTAVIERIDGVLTAVAAFRDEMQTQRAATLVLQDRAAREVAQCEAMLSRILAVRVDVAGQLLHRESASVWNSAALAGSMVDVATLGGAQLAEFVGEQRWRIALQLVVFGVLSLLMFTARRRVPHDAVFARPLSAAVLLTLLTTWWIYLHLPPRAAVALVEVLALAPALRLAQLLIKPSFAPRLGVLGALFFVDLLRYFASIVPVLEQRVFLLEMLAAVGALVWQIRSRPENKPNAMRALLAVFVVALAAGMAGYMTLGLLLGGGVIRSGYLALLFGVGVRVADSLVALAVRVAPLSRLRSIERHRAYAERRAHGLLRLVAGVAWLALALRQFGLLDATAHFAQAALAAELKRGSLSISLGDVLVFFVTVGAAFVLSGLIRFVLEEDVYPRLRGGRALPSVVSTLLHYAIVVVGFFLALAALGVDLTKVTILAGAFGVGIGFGLQGVVNNFVSGLILLVERRIDVGDAVQIGDVAGEVKQMRMRACTVRTWDGAEVIVPNASLVSERVANWTLTDRLRRVDVPVSVAYGTSPETVLELLLEVARVNKQVLLEPEPMALFLGFGESALRFELRVWTYFELWPITQSNVALAVYAALQAARIDIPFPQREVRLRS